MALCDPLLFDKRHCKHCQESHFSAQITACGDRYDFPYELSWLVPSSDHNHYKSDHNFQSLSCLRADETCDQGLNVCAGLWSQPWFCVKAWRKEGHLKSHLALTPIGHYSDCFFKFANNFSHTTNAGSFQWRSDQAAPWAHFILVGLQSPDMETRILVFIISNYLLH